MSLTARPISFRTQTKLTNSAQFDQVLRDGHKLESNGCRVYYRATSETSPKLGLVVTKRNIATAVRRNLIKRLLREAYRKHHQQLGGYEIVVMVGYKYAKFTREEIVKSFQLLWEKICKQLQEADKSQVV